LTSIPFPTACL